MKIAMLMSGGVDSSVAAQLLYNKGIDFDPYYIKISNEGEDDDYSCTQEEDVEMASAVCHKFGKRLQIIDLHNEYWTDVVGYHFDRVSKGLTPNPDVMCNTLIKFGAFIDKVGKNYDRIASGHYGRIVVGSDPYVCAQETLDNFTQLSGKHWLRTGVDPIKDQTDFLCMLNEYQLSKIMLPIGHLTKSEVREIADKYHLAPAHRKDSQGICFLGKINYNEYVQKHLGIKPGNIVEFETGKKLGEHNGFWFHTIGQRKGLHLSDGPWYVVKKDVENNVVYVSRSNDAVQTKLIKLNPDSLQMSNGFNAFPGSIFFNKVMIRIRHTSEPVVSSFEKHITNIGDEYICNSSVSISGVAPGQFCTIYTESGVVIGAAEISI